MSDLELLFLALAVLYCWECAWWMQRGSVLFRTWLGRRWCPAHPSALLGNQRAGFIFAHPLPPLGQMLAAHQLPLSLSPEALLAFVAPSVNPGGRPPQPGTLFRWDQIRSVEAKGKRVQINGRPWLTTGSPTYASHLTEQLRRLVKVAPGDRSRAIEATLRESFDTKALERRWGELKQGMPRLRLVVNLLFCYLFLAAPAMLWRFGLGLAWPGLLLGLLTLTTTTALLFRRLHKSLYPAADDERFTHFLLILLWPTTAMRAHDILSRPLLEAFHPLALARVFAPPEPFRQIAQTMLREIRHPALPLCPSDDPQARATERFWRAALQRVTEEFLEQNDVQPAQLLQPPPRADDSCLAYCPRCLAQFTASTGLCDDCGGLTLVAFSGTWNNP